MGFYSGSFRLGRSWSTLSSKFRGRGEFSPMTEPTLDSYNAPAVTDQDGGLWSPSFVGLLITQFLGAMNDNMFRWLAVWIGKDIVGKDYETSAVGVGLAMLSLPFIVFAAPAGYVADRFSKRSVIVNCKLAEIVIMVIGVVAVWTGNIYFMFAVLFVMGAQSAMFGPSKYGSIPEIVPASRLSVANGWVGMTTLMSIVLGTVIASQLHKVLNTAQFAADSAKGLDPAWRPENLWVPVLALVGVAAAGFLASLMIRPLPVADPKRRFPLFWPAQTYDDFRSAAKTRALLLAVFGSALFWAIAALCQVNIDLFGDKTLHLDPGGVSVLLGFLTIGVGIGSAAAGYLSGRKIELGLVPIGAFGMGIGALVLSTFLPGETPIWGTRFNVSLGALFLLGMFGGCYDIPIQAFIQYRSDESSRGSVLAAANFATFVGTLAISFLFPLLGDWLKFSGPDVFFLMGVCLIPFTGFLLYLIGEHVVTFLVELFCRVFYRVHVEGLENIPDGGGVLLVSNHVSWMDGIMLMRHTPRHVHFLTYADYIEKWWLYWFARRLGLIPIRPRSKTSIVESIRAAREELRSGKVVGIFPEGALTRDGKTGEFERGFLAILKDTDAVVLPVYLAGLWGSIFSFDGGKCFWKIPKRVPYPITIRYGRPMEEVPDAEAVRRAVLTLAPDEDNPG